MRNVGESIDKAKLNLVVFAKGEGGKDRLVGKWVKRDRPIHFHKFLIWLTRKFPEWSYINVYEEGTRKYLRRVYR